MMNSLLINTLMVSLQCFCNKLLACVAGCSFENCHPKYLNPILDRIIAISEDLIKDSKEIKQKLEEMK